MPWVGSSGPVGAADAATAAEHLLAGLRVEGAHLRPLHLRRADLRHAQIHTARADVMPGGYSCGLKTRGGYIPGTCGGRRRYHFFLGGGPCCCRTSAPTGSAAARSAASSPVIVLTSSRRSCRRPIQICLGGRTCICEVTAAPAGISCGGRLKPKRSSPSGSSPSSATSTGALARLATVTS